MRAGTDDRSGLPLLDDGGAVKGCARWQAVAVIDPGRYEAARFGKVGRSLALEGQLCAGIRRRRDLEAQGGRRTRGDDALVQDLNEYRRAEPFVQFAIDHLEGREQCEVL